MNYYFVFRFIRKLFYYDDRKFYEKERNEKEKEIDACSCLAQVAPCLNPSSEEGGKVQAMQAQK